MTDPLYRWMTIPQAARYFQKDESVIRRWCYSGFVFENGWRAHRDPKGYWRIGIPYTSDAGTPCNTCA